MTGLNDTLNVTREPPKPRTFSKAYWDATREKRLLLQFDKRSGKYQFFPRATSIYNGHRDLEWREVSGKGQIFSFPIADRARPPFQGHEPFAIGLVTLDEGVNVMANIVRCTRDQLKIGLRVKPFWTPLANGTHLLMFEPAWIEEGEFHESGEPIRPRRRGRKIDAAAFGGDRGHVEQARHRRPLHPRQSHAQQFRRRYSPRRPQRRHHRGTDGAGERRRIARGRRPRDLHFAGCRRA